MRKCGEESKPRHKRSTEEEDETHLIVLDRTALRQFDKVRLVGTGVNEIISIHSALDSAEEQGLDLVLVSDKPVPPVVRIQDFRKIEYERRKARKHQKKVTHQSVLKEIQLRVNISDHDLQTKVTRGKKFLARGDKVKVVVQLRGRERDFMQKAWNLIDRFAESSQPCRIQKGSGPTVTCMLEPEKTAKKS